MLKLQKGATLAVVPDRNDPMAPYPYQIKLAVDSKKWLHIWFWGVIGGFAGGLAINPILIVAAVSAAGFMVVLGNMARLLARSALIWVGLTLLFSPLSYPIAYLSMIRLASEKQRGLVRQEQGLVGT